MSDADGTLREVQPVSSERMSDAHRDDAIIEWLIARLVESELNTLMSPDDWYDEAKKEVTTVNTDTPTPEQVLVEAVREVLEIHKDWRLTHTFSAAMKRLRAALDDLTPQEPCAEEGSDDARES